MALNLGASMWGVYTSVHIATREKSGRIKGDSDAVLVLVKAKNTSTEEPGQIYKFKSWPLRYIIGPEHICVAAESGASVYHLSNLNTPIMTSVHACDAEYSRNKPLSGRTGILPVLIEQTSQNTRRSSAATTKSYLPQQREQQQRPHRVSPLQPPRRVELVDVATRTRLAIITIPYPLPPSIAAKCKH
ncbi:hypothetical protein Pelo_16725 [Pelomyxa schiedti]|nr:hypothetical protein Pelo_16725 [Pelomyxa schiedti]